MCLQGLHVLWRKTFAADANVDAVIREFCTRQRLIVDTCILEHAGHPLSRDVRLDQVFENVVALLHEGLRSLAFTSPTQPGLTALRYLVHSRQRLMLVVKSPVGNIASRHAG